MQSAPTNERTTESTTPRPRGLWLALLLVAAGIATWGNALAGPFVFDDVPQIAEDPSIRSLWPLSGVVEGTNRPVLKLTLAANWALGGGSVRGFHLTNVAIHILAALVLFGVVRRTLRGTVFRGGVRASAAPLAFAVALLWLVHPLQTESVTYVFQRCESLMGLFFLLTLYATVRAATGEHPRRWLAMAVAAAALGIGTKEVMVTAPLVVLLYDRAFLAGSLGRALRRRGGFYLALASLWLVTGLLVTGLLFKAGTTAGFGVESIGPLRYALAQPGVVLHYLLLSFWPRGLCLDYGWAPVEDFLGLVAPLLLVGGLLAITGWGLWRNTWFGFVGASFFLVLAPSSSFLPIQDLAVEHRMYLPLAAVVICVVVGAHHVLAGTSSGARRLGPSLLILVALALGWRTVLRNRDYADAVSLWETVVARAPANPRGHLMLGNALREAGRIAEAQKSFEAALRLDPDHIPALTNLGSLHQLLGDHRAAIGCFRRVAILEPGPEHDTNLGNAYLRAGRVDEAIRQYKKALSRQPGFAPAQSNFGAALIEKGRVNEALLHLEQALAVEPEDVAALTNLGNALYRNGDVDGAVDRYRRALEIDPDYGLAHVNLGEVFLAEGKAAEAVPHLRRARALAPAAPDRACALGRALLAAGQPGAALSEFRAALGLRPDYAEALLSAAEALLAGGDPAGYDADEVAGLAERAARVTRDHAPATLVRVAQVNAAVGNLPRAIEVLERAMSLTEDSAARTKLAERRDAWRRELAERGEGGPR